MLKNSFLNCVPGRSSRYSIFHLSYCANIDLLLGNNEPAHVPFYRKWKSKKKKYIVFWCYSFIIFITLVIIVDVTFWPRRRQNIIYIYIGMEVYMHCIPASFYVDVDDTMVCAESKFFDNHRSTEFVRIFVTVHITRSHTLIISHIVPTVHVLGALKTLFARNWKRKKLPRFFAKKKK